ncbi:hypothetical protein GGI02_001511, partial [Coemansia sp. RSA 2322]
MANDTTDKRTVHALNDLVAATKHRPHLHAVLFGDHQPRFASGNEPAAEAAVRLAVSALDVALIHGLSGIGKTHTAVEIVLQLVARNNRVLVCGPSNVSVDNLVERLAAVRGLPLVRLGHPARLLPAAVAHSLNSHTKYSEQAQLVCNVQADLDDVLAQIHKSRRSSERRALYQRAKELRAEYRQKEAK